MKYEAVFGDQSLFDGANDCHVFACKKDSGEMYWHDESFLGACGVTVHGHIAMRRIIPEPKRWTVADQKAGRLPEVGAEYNFDGCIVEHLGNGAAGYQNIFYFKYPSGACGNAYGRSVKPIETPEEKAQREEDEFVKSEMENTTLSMEWSCIYERGLRAAYRKLKGGE